MRCAGRLLVARRGHLWRHDPPRVYRMRVWSADQHCLVLSTRETRVGFSPERSPGRAADLTLPPLPVLTWLRGVVGDDVPVGLYAARAGMVSEGVGCCFVGVSSQRGRLP